MISSFFSKTVSESTIFFWVESSNKKPSFLVREKSWGRSISCVTYFVGDNGCLRTQPELCLFGFCCSNFSFRFNDDSESVLTVGFLLNDFLALPYFDALDDFPPPGTENRLFYSLSLDYLLLEVCYPILDILSKLVVSWYFSVCLV